MQLVSASEGLVEIYYALDLIKPVGCLGKLGLQKVLLGCEYFQVVRISVVHQELGVPYCSLEVDDLFLAEFHSLLCSLPHGKCIVHFHSRIKKALSEPVCSLLVLSLGCLQTCLVDSASEYRLCYAGYEIGYETARVKDDIAVSSCPSEGSAEAEVRLERCSG